MINIMRSRKWKMIAAYIFASRSASVIASIADKGEEYPWASFSGFRNG